MPLALLHDDALGRIGLILLQRSLPPPLPRRLVHLCDALFLWRFRFLIASPICVFSCPTQAFDHLPLHLSVLSAFCVHNLAAAAAVQQQKPARGASGSGLPAPASAAPTSPVITASSYALCIALRLGAALATAAAASPWGQQGHGALMAGALILLQLLAGHASLLVATALPGDGAAAAAAGPGAGAGGVDGEEVVRLVEFCSAITRYERMRAPNLQVCQHKSLIWTCDL